MNKPSAEKILTKRVPKWTSDPALAAVRVEVLSCGVTLDAVARAIGVAESTLRKVLNGRPSEMVRRKIEDYFQRPFWTSEAEWKRRN